MSRADSRIMVSYEFIVPLAKDVPVTIAGPREQLVALEKQLRALNDFVPDGLEKEYPGVEALYQALPYGG